MEAVSNPYFVLSFCLAIRGCMKLALLRYWMPRFRFAASNTKSVGRPGLASLATHSSSPLLQRTGAHEIFFLAFAHLARAAFWAISRRCSDERDAALASPPFLAPSLDKATAWGFFFFSTMVPILCMPHPAAKDNIYLST